MPKGGDQNQDPGGAEVLHSGRLGSDLSEEEADNSPSKVDQVHIDDDMFGIRTIIPERCIEFTMTCLGSWDWD